MKRDARRIRVGSRIAGKAPQGLPSSGKTRRPRPLCISLIHRAGKLSPFSKDGTRGLRDHGMSDPEFRECEPFRGRLFNVARVATFALSKRLEGLQS